MEYNYINNLNPSDLICIEENNNYENNQLNEDVFNKIFNINSNKDIDLNEEDPKQKKVKITMLNKKRNRRNRDETLCFEYSKYNGPFKSMFMFVHKHKKLSESEKENLKSILFSIKKSAIKLYNTCKNLGQIDESGHITDNKREINMNNVINNASEEINKVLKKINSPLYVYRPQTKIKQVKIPFFSDAKDSCFFKSITKCIKNNKNIQKIQGLREKLKKKLDKYYQKALELYNSCKELKKVDRKGNITDIQKHKEMKNIKNKLLKNMNILLKSYGLSPYDYRFRDESEKIKNIPFFNKTEYFKPFNSINAYLKNNKNIQKDKNLQKESADTYKVGYDNALKLYKSCRKLGKVDENGKITDYNKNKKMKNIKNKLLKDMNILLKNYGLSPYYYKPKK